MPEGVCHNYHWLLFVLVIRNSTIIVMEYVNGVDYIKFAHYFNACASYQSTTIPKLSKCELKQLLSIAHSDQEREVIRYTAVKASRLSATAARKYYGFEDMSNRLLKVQKTIRDCVDELGRTQELVALKAMGFDTGSNESSVDEEDTSDSDMVSVNNDDTTSFNVDEYYGTLKQAQFNWFHFAEDMVNVEEVQLENYYLAVMSSDKPQSEKMLIELSHKAYIADLQLRKFTEREAAAFNGDIVTDSEDDDPDVYTKINDLFVNS